MKICGVDPSSSFFGVALLEGDDLLVTDVWKRPKKGSAPQRLTECFTWFEEWLQQHQPDMAAIEFLSVERNAQATRVVATYQGISALACKRAGLIVVEGRVTSARRIVLGDGGASKEKAFNMIKERFPDHNFGRFDQGGADKADAVVMALAGPDLAEN